MDRQVVIVSAVRTPIGRFQGTLAATPAVELGAIVIREALSRAGVGGELVDEVLMGQVIQAGAGQAPARQAALKAGLPESIGATTINKVCGSGLKSVIMASQAIRAGDARCIVAGGMENMNLGPHLLPGARRGYRLGPAQILDATVHDGLWCSCEQWHMGDAAEHIAQERDVSREDQDRYALESHRRAIRAIDGGLFAAETVPVPLDGKLFQVDEGPRRDTSLQKLAALRPAFQPEGTVTAGNAPSINDGAAVVVVMEARLASELGIEPLARIVGHAQAAVAPKKIFWAPIEAVPRVLERTGWALGEIDLIELNEAFAAQVLADGRALGLDFQRVNVHGGAIALGHPLGASGCRVLVTLLHAMRQRGARRGLASLCLGGGEAVAMAVEAAA